MIIDEINISPLLKAFKKFEEFRDHLNTEQERAGSIQAFEYCYELTWKTMKRLLEKRGHITNSPRETFRIAAMERFIDNPEIWFDFLKMRSITVHTYEEKEAEKVISIFQFFSSEMKSFIKNIGV